MRVRFFGDCDTLDLLAMPTFPNLHPFRRLRSGFALSCGLFFVASASAESDPDEAAIRAAVSRSLPLLTEGARVSMKERARCYTCHNQGLPIMVLGMARGRGFEIDEAEWRAQMRFTAAFLDKNRENYLVGKGQGGQSSTAGSALWALESGGWKPDETTAAVAEYLILWKKELGHWTAQSRRPPTEGSPFTSTHAALRGLLAFGTPEQRERIEERIEAVRKWVIATPAVDTEDRVFRMRTLRLLEAPDLEIAAAKEALLSAQREDGGWAQLDDGESDAYATGTALASLNEAGGMPTTDEAYRRGLGYLLSGQLEDGSWHVATRSEPIQTYYESGYPHGKDQFLSISAGSWATIALVLALPVVGEVVP